MDLKNTTAADQRSRETIAKMYENFGDDFFRVKGYEKAILWYQMSLQICTAIGDRQGTTRHHGKLGDAYLSLEKYRKAIENFQKGLEMSAVIRDQSRIAINNCKLGIAYGCLEEYEKAIDHYKKALGIAKAVSNQLLAVLTYDNLGQSYFCLKDYKKAIDNYEQGLLIMTVIGNHQGIATEYTKLGIIHGVLGEHEKAINYHQKGLEVSTANDDLSGMASGCSNLGSAYQELEEYAKAINCYKKSLELNTAIGDRFQMARVNCNLGNTYRLLREYQTGMDYHLKSLEINGAVGDPSIAAKNNGNLGNIYLCLSEYKKAIGYYKIALELNTAEGNRLEIAYNTCNLGSAYRALGEYQTSIEYHHKSLEMSTAVGDRSEMARNSYHLGSTYLCIGEYQKAVHYCQEGLEMSTEIGYQSGIASNICSLGQAYLRLGEYMKAVKCYENGLEMIGDPEGIYNGALGNAYNGLGEYEKAINYTHKSLEISVAIGNRSEIAAGYLNLGNGYRYLGEYEKAINYCQKGLEVSKTIGDQSKIAGNYLNLGNVYDISGEYKKANDYYQTSLEISTRIGDQEIIAKSNCNLGDVDCSLGNYQTAIDNYEKAIQVFTAIGDEFEIAKSIGKLGNGYLCLEEYEKAALHYTKSIGLLDRMFLNMVPDQSKLSFTQHYFHSHITLMSCLISLERTNSALLVHDLGKAKELHCCIERRQCSPDREMFDYARAIWKKIEKGEEQMEMEEIQSIIHVEIDTTVLIFAFDLDGSLNLWIINREVIFRKHLASSEELVLLIQELLGRVNLCVNRNSSFFKLDSIAIPAEKMVTSFERPTKKTACETLTENSAKEHQFSSIEILKKMYKIIIDPVKNNIEDTKLIVVPDRQLFFLPFSSLIDENGCHLSHSYGIQISPSLHTLKFSMEQSDDINCGYALFVGNPTVGKVSLNGEEITPVDLPSARDEVKCLAKLFDARPLMGQEAKKQVVLDLLGSASIVHIAAHGEPRRGEIMLVPSQATLFVPTPEEYLLTQQDISKIPLQARLVVLCCCHTGKGKLTSEGVIGITRAFLAAGARSVLATLWPINDYATKEFMETFYYELCQETPVCEALRKTMNLFQKHEKEEYRSATIWAPFVIYGEDVKFQKHDLVKIREKSREMFSGFVVLP